MVGDAGVKFALCRSTFSLHSVGEFSAALIFDEG